MFKRIGVMFVEVRSAACCSKDDGEESKIERGVKMCGTRWCRYAFLAEEGAEEDLNLSSRAVLSKS